MFPPSPLFLVPQSPGCNCTAGYTFTPQHPVTGEGIQFINTAALKDCDSMIPITGFRWDFGDGQTCSLPNPVHAYASAGTYSVGQVVTFDNGQTCEEEKQITVSESGVCNCTADFTFAPENLAPGEEVRFIGQSAPGRECPPGTTIEWAWDFTSDGSVDSNEQNPVHSYTDYGTYRATLTITCHGFVSTLTKDVTVVNDTQITPSPTITTPTMTPSMTPTTTSTTTLTPPPQITLRADILPLSVTPGTTSEIQVTAEHPEGGSLEGTAITPRAVNGTFESAGNSTVEGMTDTV